MRWVENSWRHDILADPSKQQKNFEVFYVNPANKHVDSGHLDGREVMRGSDDCADGRSNAVTKW